MATKRRWTWLAGFVVLVAVACNDRPALQPPAEDADQSAISEFNQRITEYVALHRRAARPLGEADDTKQPAEITARETALAHAIRIARQQAKPGDVFTTDASAALKTVIAENYRRSASGRETRQDAEAELPDFTPVVNEVYPSTHPLGTFPATLLRVLPPLPDELEYRIVTHHLILRDVGANLIVDVLPNAVP